MLEREIHYGVMKLTIDKLKQRPTSQTRRYLSWYILTGEIAFRRSAIVSCAYCSPDKLNISPRILFSCAGLTSGSPLEHNSGEDR